MAAGSHIEFAKKGDISLCTYELNIFFIEVTSKSNHIFFQNIKEKFTLEKQYLKESKMAAGSHIESGQKCAFGHILVNILV